MARMSALRPSTQTIRSATPADYEMCLLLDHSVSTETVWQMSLEDSDGAQTITFRPARLPRSTRVLYPRSSDTLLESWNRHSSFLVAEYDQEVIGYVNAREEASLEAAWIADLVVDRAFRLKGIGTALLRAAREWALEHKLRRLIVETHTKNHPAISFLQKRGLILCGYNDLYFPNQDIAIFFGQTLR
jgi:GNAT superfamily N-acetyltransferase